MTTNYLNNIHILYKYRYFDNDNYHIRIILDNEFYLASKEELNDPFDLSLRPRYEVCSEEELLEHAKQIIVNDLYATDAEKKQKWIEIENEIKYDRNTYIKRYKSAFEMAMTKAGICSMTADKWGSPLMWAHYCNNHTGFCIGLNWHKLQIHLSKIDGVPILPLPVVYDNTIKIINPLSGDQTEALRLTFSYKSSDWEYENEIRLINFKGAKNSFKIPDDCFEEVIVGLNCSNENLNLIKNALRMKKANVKLNRINLDENSFSLIKQKLDY